MNYGIFGLGITGKSVVDYLNQYYQANIICFDEKSEINHTFQELYSSNFLAPLTDKRWEECDCLIISPGVKKSNPIYQIARRCNILVSSDIELFFNHVTRLKKKANTNIPYLIGITGTNGKSTTTALTKHLFTDHNKKYSYAGNIGVPILSLLKDEEQFMQHEGIIIELSSFQLDLLPKKRFLDAGALLNITPDHLDHHGSFEEYLETKQKIFDISKNIIINSSDANIKKITTKQDVAVYSYDSEANISLPNKAQPISCKENLININVPHGLRGNHNLQNIAASVAIGISIGYSIENLIPRIASYEALPYRMQKTGEILKHNICFINDSKATNTNAVTYALESFNNIFWIAGGIFKETEFELSQKLCNNIFKGYFFGRDKELLAKFAEGKIKYKIFNNLAEALIASYNDAINAKDETVKNILLSPACSSFDQYKNFIHRGESFDAIVQEIIQNTPQ